MAYGVVEGAGLSTVAWRVVHMAGTKVKAETSDRVVAGVVMGDGGIATYVTQQNNKRGLQEPRLQLNPFIKVSSPLGGDARSVSAAPTPARLRRPGEDTTV
jgi:hypothetical protein